MKLRGEEPTALIFPSSPGMPRMPCRRAHFYPLPPVAHCQPVLPACSPRCLPGLFTTISTISFSRISHPPLLNPPSLPPLPRLHADACTPQRAGGSPEPRDTGAQRAQRGLGAGSHTAAGDGGAAGGHWLGWHGNPEGGAGQQAAARPPHCAAGCIPAAWTSRVVLSCCCPLCVHAAGCDRHLPGPS